MNSKPASRLLIWGIASLLILVVVVFMFFPDERGTEADLQSPSDSETQQPEVPHRSPPISSAKPKEQEIVVTETGGDSAEAIRKESSDSAPGLRHLHTRVLSDALVPIPGAEVRIHGVLKEYPGRLESNLEKAPMETGRTDAQGCYVTSELGLTFSVSANKEGLGDSGLYHSRPGRSELLLILERPWQLRGIVLDEAGLPLAGASVIVEGGAVSGGSGRTKSKTPPPSLTDSEGRFDMPLGGGGSIFVRATHEGKESPKIGVDSRRPQEVVEVILQMPGRFEVRGRILDDSHRSTAGASIQLWGADLQGFPDTAFQWRTEIKAEEDGSFRVGLPAAGQYRIKAEMKSGDRSLPAEFDVSDSDPRKSLDLKLARLTTIPVKLISAQGRPIQDALIEAFPSEDERGSLFVPSSVDLWGKARGTTDKEGRIELAGLTEGKTYKLQWSRDKGLRIIERPAVVANGSEYVFRVTAEDTKDVEIRGLLLNAENDRPLAGISLQLSYITNHAVRKAGHATTTADGQFSFEGLQMGGRYKISVEHQRGQSHSLFVYWEMESLDDDMDISLRPFALFPLRIELVDVNDRLLPYHAISYRKVDAGGQFSRVTKRMDEFGRDEVDNFLGGIYQFFLPGEREAFKTIDLLQDPREALRISLPSRSR